MKVLFSAFLCSLAHVAVAQDGEASLPFTYLDESDENGWGVKDWDKVKTSEFYFDWNPYHTKANFDNNYCEWKPDDGDHKQSPIDIDDWDDCDDEKDDKHRWVLATGDCEWKHVNFNIEPWGLAMTFDEPSSGNPEGKPCKKPNFDSSGGYGARFHLNMMYIKTPSEHTIKGERFDAELVMTLFRYRVNKDKGPPYTTHVMVKARPGNVDNPILEDYLNAWWTKHMQVQSACAEQYEGDVSRGYGSLAPTLSPAPSLSPTESPTASPTVSAAPTFSITCEEEQSLDSFDRRIGGEGTDHEGLMFDVVNEHPTRDVILTSFDVNVQEETETNIQIFTTDGSWIGKERPEVAEGATTVSPKAFGAWTPLGTYTVVGAGEGNPTRVALDEELRLEVNTTRAFYIVQVDEGGSGNLQNIRFDRDEVGDVVEENEYLSTRVGMAIQYFPFSDEPDKEFDYGRGFSGAVNYRVCKRTNGSDRKQRRYLQTPDTSMTDEPMPALRDPEDRLEVFQLYPSPWYFRYRGSLTHPGCYDETRVRVVDRPLEISEAQLEKIEIMISEMRDSACYPGTVGKPRADDSTYVDVVRPLQKRNRRHNLKYCNMRDWGDWNFFKKARGNTCWCLLNGDCDKCDMDGKGNCRDDDDCDSHWPSDEKW